MLDVINPEFEVVIGEKSFTCKALSLNSLLKLSRQLKRKEYVDNAKLVAETLPSNERSAFMMKTLMELNKPDKFDDEFSFADSLFSSVRGIIEIVKFAILKFNTIDENELDTLIDEHFTSDYFEYVSKIAYKIIGVETEENTEEPEDKKKQKKTTTKRI